MPSSDLVVKIPFVGKDHVSKEISKMRGNMRGFGDTSRSVFNRIKKDSLSAKSVIGGILGASAIQSGVSLLRNQVDTVIDELVSFDHAAVKASSRYGFDRNAKEFELIGMAARKTGAETRFTAAEAAKAIDSFAMSNFRLEDSMRLIPTTARLAMAADLELADSAKIAATSLALFGKEASDFESVADVLAFTANSTKTDLAEMFETLRAGGATKVSGVSEFSAVARAMADFGIVGSKAGTSIKTGFLRLTTGSKEAGKELKKLGVKYYDVIDGKKESRSVIDIIEDLEKKMGKMGSASKSTSMKKIFGLEAITGMDKVFKTGTATLRQYMAEADAANGYVDKTSEKMALSYENKIKSIQSAIVEAGFSIVDKYGDEIPGALDFVIEKIRNLDVGKIHSGIERGLNMSKDVVRLVKDSIPYLKTIGILWAGFRVTSGMNTMVSSLNHVRQAAFMLNNGLDPASSNYNALVKTLKKSDGTLDKINKKGVAGLSSSIDATNVKALGLVNTLGIAATVGFAAYTAADDFFKLRDAKVESHSAQSSKAEDATSWKKINSIGSMEEASKYLDKLKWAEYNAKMGSGISRSNIADSIGATFTGQESNREKQSRLADEYAEKRKAVEKIWDVYADGQMSDVESKMKNRELESAAKKQVIESKIKVETVVKFDGTNVPAGVSAESNIAAPPINRNSLGEN